MGKIDHADDQHAEESRARHLFASRENRLCAFLLCKFSPEVALFLRELTHDIFHHHNRAIND